MAGVATIPPCLVCECENPRLASVRLLHPCHYNLFLLQTCVHLHPGEGARRHFAGKAARKRCPARAALLNKSLVSPRVPPCPATACWDGHAGISLLPLPARRVSPARGTRFGGAAASWAPFASRAHRAQATQPKMPPQSLTLVRWRRSPPTRPRPPPRAPRVGCAPRGCPSAGNRLNIVGVGD